MDPAVWQMGKYGAYVWSSVGLTLVVLLANIWSARAALRAARDSARRALRSESRR